VTLGRRFGDASRGGRGQQDKRAMAETRVKMAKTRLKVTITKIYSLVAAPTAAGAVTRSSDLYH